MADAATRILAFANSLDLNSPSFVVQMRSNIAMSPIMMTPGQRMAIEARGVELWNTATRLGRSGDPSNDDVTRACLLRIFAFSMIDSAAENRSFKSPKFETNVRVLKVAFKCMKSCMERNELAYASYVARRMAKWLADNELLGDLRPKLTGEYLVWRMALAWKQNNIDLAEYMYHKYGEAEPYRFDGEFAETLADMLFEIGKSLCANRHFDAATRWLGRALDVLDKQDLEMLSDDASDLRLSIMQHLVKSMLGEGSTESRAKARELIHSIDHDYADKLVAALLRLELLTSEQDPDAVEYYDATKRMVQTMTLSQSNFKTIIYHIHGLKKLNVALASRLLNELITLRLQDGVKEEWLERACMMQIWIVTSTDEMKCDAAALKEMLDTMLGSNLKTFSAAAAHAAQTVKLLWKHIEISFSERHFDIAQDYCNLAGHQLFDKGGELNRSKIARKAIMCASNRGDDTAARTIFFQMPKSVQDMPQTRQLMYRAAIRMGDTDLAAKCLDIVSKASGQDHSLLYACVMDAQSIDDKRQALAALTKLLECCGTLPPKEVNFPALLRCTIRLQRAEATNDKLSIDDRLVPLCELFESAAVYVKRYTSSASIIEITEVEWFSKNAYNMAVGTCQEAHPMLTFRLCSACKSLIELMDRDTLPAEKHDLRLRHIICEYLMLSTKVVLARAEDSIEISLDHYLDVTKAAKHLRHLITEQMTIISLPSAVKADFIAKHIQSIKFELEAVLHLCKWDDLDSLFNECWLYEDPKRWETLADLAFNLNDEICAKEPEVIQAYQSKVLQFIQRIINKSWKPNEGVDKLARWIRCLFHIAMVKSENIAMHCLDQAISIVGKCKTGKFRFPPTELEWLAATAFNHAITYYCIHDRANCELWAEKSMLLATQAVDQSLAQELRSKFAELSWEDDGATR